MTSPSAWPQSSGLNQRIRKALDGDIAAGLDAPEQPTAPFADWLPSEMGSLNLADAGITPVLWATGYGLDLSLISLPVLDKWGCPKHSLAVKELTRLYAVGLPRLTRHYSSILGGVGMDAKKVL
ncbi:hypothetical protein HP499_13690 [Paenarthrobacter sp. CM16]|uniref:hypothetical protein n=1 Tax=Paenarthrobacter sp. CM16 TaxID=2738447 RepID=UPI00155639DF|nr:hypothetical protein [Paenarthrobacter sp. CM16]NQD88847.1 hypothetical protein [Paenarthrobacter sp. CM16]